MNIIRKGVLYMAYTTQYSSPVGNLVLASDGANLTGLWLEGQKYFMATVKGEILAQDDSLPVFAQTRQWLDRYFAGERPAPCELPLAPMGSPFRKAVWACLCQIPYGEVTTYGAIAKKLAPMLGREHLSAQAVGGAVGHNPISIIIPCHRVVGTDGSLTGYAGGIHTKEHLLRLEGAAMEGLFVPGETTK